MKSTLHLKGKKPDIESRHAILAEVLAKSYISIAEIDLNSGYAVVLKSDEDSELEGCELSWDEVIQRYAKRRAYPDDRDTVLALTYDYLKTYFSQGNEEFSREVRCIADHEVYIWMEISISVVLFKKDSLLVTTRNIGEDRMLRSIVDLFVYQNYDYFILLDANHNSYTMYSGLKNGTPLPPTFSNDYTAQVLKYNQQFVVPEDFERVTANMQIPHILDMLEKEEKYSFSSGGISNQGKYRRTQVQFQYYDKSAGLILLTRTDVTRIFMEEQAKNDRLAVAIRDAQHDALTGIYNQKATAKLIVELLESQYRSQAAFFFIDIDNFKMINDTLGHQKGDDLLCFLAQSIKDIAGRSGIAGRVGGDEFLVFLPFVPTIGEIERCAQQICGLFDSLQDDTIKALPLSCSVGIATYPKDGTNYEMLVRKADQALYTSKRYGKNQFYFYSQKL